MAAMAITATQTTSDGPEVESGRSEEERRVKPRNVGRTQSDDKLGRSSAGIDRPAKRGAKSEQAVKSKHTKSSKKTNVPRREMTTESSVTARGFAPAPSDDSRAETRRQEKRRAVEEEKSLGGASEHGHDSTSTPCAAASRSQRRRTEDKAEKHASKDDRNEKGDRDDVGCERQDSKDEKSDDGMSEVIDAMTMVASATRCSFDLETPSKPVVGPNHVEQVGVEDSRAMGFEPPLEKGVVPVARSQSRSDPQASRPSKNYDVFQDVKSMHLVIIFCVMQMPSYLALFAFSWMGYGPNLFRMLASREVDRIGNAVMGCFAAFVALAFIFDAPRAGASVRNLLRATAFLLLFVGVLLKGVQVSAWYPLLLTLYAGPICLLGVRSLAKMTERRQFYGLVAVCLVWTGTCVLAVWVVAAVVATDYTSKYGLLWSDATRAHLIEETSTIYDSIYSRRPLAYLNDCGTNATSLANEADAVKFACERVEIVQLMIWTTPHVVLIFNVTVGIFCILQARLDLNFDADVVRLIRTIVLVVVFFFVVLYAVTGYIGGYSDALARLAWPAMFCAFSALAVFIVCEVKPDVLDRLSEKSTTVKYVQKAYRSNWVRAGMCVVWGTLMPIYLVLDCFRQMARKCKGTATSMSASTDQGLDVREHFYGWLWTDILCKIVWLGVLGVMLIVGGKLTFVFFSWLNELLAAVDLPALCVVVLVVGVIMFLLPPVPGSAVYLFAGIVIGRKSLESMNIWTASLVGTGVGLVGKLLGCLGQYGIGVLLGKSLQVQKLIGVDTVPTRALEQILKRPGFGLGKLAILVAGPDWPTSVTCGILRMSVVSMIVGTMPVVVVSIYPQTLVGALLVLDTSVDPAFWGVIRSACTGGAGVAQAAMSMVALYYITKTIEEDGEALAKPRPEHEKVAELTALTARYMQAYEWVTDWHSPQMTLRRKVTITSGALLMVMVGFIMGLDYGFREPVCFRSFEITKDIDAPMSEGGLDGNILNIVIFPLGWVALGVFSCALVAFKLFTTEMSRLASRMAAMAKE